MIDVNKKYRTRDGHLVRLICADNIDNREVVIGLVQIKVPEASNGTTTEEPAAWYRDTGQWIGDGKGVATFDLIKIQPWESWPRDEPVWVRFYGAQSWGRRHFAGADENGEPQAWIDGLTSWTTDKKYTWEEIRLASEFTPD